MRFKLSSEVAIVLILLWSASSGAANGQFPLYPNSQLTPGQLCHQSTNYRYPEKIAYCERDVSPQAKRTIIQAYDSHLGYKIAEMKRQDFKIDHYIPLCMGGSNDKENLWPQHKSIYEVTDPLEPVLCNKMAEGRLKQVDAIKFMKEAKADISKVESILLYAESL